LSPVSNVSFALALDVEGMGLNLYVTTLTTFLPNLGPWVMFTIWLMSDYFLVFSYLSIPISRNI